MTNVWKIAPGTGAENWKVFSERGCIGLGWLKGDDYQRFRSEEEVLLTLEQQYGKNAKGAGSGSAKIIWRFVHEIQQSHVVVANEGYNRVVGIGIVQGGYLAPTSPQNPMKGDRTTHRHHVRRVQWLITKPVDLDGNRFFVQPTLWPLEADKVNQIKGTYLTAYADDSEVKEALARLFDRAEEDEQYTEGRELLRLHRRKERNRKAVLHKKEKVLAANGKLLCEVCAFDFAEVYGVLGNGFAECHHRVPLAHLKEEHRIRLSELAIVCANCHRMLHRQPLHSVQQLRKIVLSQRGQV